MLVYVLANTKNGKLYIGKTTKTLQWRIWQHCYQARRGSKMLISRAIRKYGWNAFKAAVLCWADSEEELNRLEKGFITLFRTNDPKRGYNLTEGGDGTSGYHWSPETRAKMEAAIARRKPRNRAKPQVGYTLYQAVAKGDTNHLKEVAFGGTLRSPVVRELAKKLLTEVAPK